MQARTFRQKAAAETKEFQKTRDQSAKEVMILELEIQARAANAELEAERKKKQEAMEEA